MPFGNELYETIDQKVNLEASNVLLQFDEVIRLIEESNGQLELSSHLVKRLHEVAMKGIYRCAGTYRDWPVTINRASHKPPEHRFVADCVDQMCETANTPWNGRRFKQVPISCGGSVGFIPSEEATAAPPAPFPISHSPFVLASGCRASSLFPNSSSATARGTETRTQREFLATSSSRRVSSETTRPRFLFEHGP